MRKEQREKETKTERIFNFFFFLLLFRRRGNRMLSEYYYSGL
jgi:hypothetical protein